MVFKSTAIKTTHYLHAEKLHSKKGTMQWLLNSDERFYAYVYYEEE